MMNYTLNLLSKLYADANTGGTIKTPFADTIAEFTERERAVLDRLTPQNIGDLYLTYLQGIKTETEATPTDYEPLRTDSEHPPEEWKKAYTLREVYKFSWVRIGSEIKVTDKTAKNYYLNYLNFLNDEQAKKPTDT